MKLRFAILIHTLLIFLGSSMKVVAAPEAPIVTSSINGLTVTIAWTPVPGATEYKLSYAPIPYTGPESIGSLNVGGVTSFSATLWEGAAFYIAVQAGDGQAYSDYSNIDNFVIASSSASLTGGWLFIETVGPNNCEIPAETQISYYGVVTQSVRTLTVQTSTGLFNGNLIGSTVSLTGSLQENEKTTSSMFNLFIQPGNTLVGSSSWLSTIGDFNCSGTSSITATKVN